MRPSLAMSAVLLAVITFSHADNDLQARQAASAGRASGTAVEPGSVTTGLATGHRPVAGITPACTQKVNVQPDVFPVTVGTYTSPDGRTWTVPGTGERGSHCC